LEAVQIVDFQNKLVLEEGPKYSLEKPVPSDFGANFAAEYVVGNADTKRVFVYEYEHQREKFIETKFYSQIIIAYEIGNPEAITDEEKRVGESLLEEFIDAYRFFSKDSRVRLPNDVTHERYVTKEAIITYTAEELG
jgi:hypothetical protein